MKKSVDHYPMWNQNSWRRSLEVRIAKYGPFDRAWALSMKNRHGGRVLALHNPKHVSEMHLKAPHIIAAYERTGKPLAVKKRYGAA